MRTILLIIALLLARSAAAHQVHVSSGEMVYREGMLPSAMPVRGEREAGVSVEGTAAACVTCHRRSGYGESEGQIRVPPITGAILFRPEGKHPLDTQAGAGYTPGRGAYTDETLARAIREGIVPTGRALSYVMPRYPLDDATMASLIEYLKGLSTDVSPGVTGDTLHFATIVTPDADAKARQGMLDVLQHFIEDKNDFRKGGTRSLKRNAQINFRVVRRWELHLWQLKGAPETWDQQLKQKLSEQPVFAVLSGLAGKTWAPVHHFCQEAAIPCLFPNVDLPVVAEKDFYSVYFSKGVLLEAQLVAKQLAEQGSQWGVRRVVQVYREGDIGEEAAKTLAAEVSAAKLKSVNHAIRAGASPKAESSALKDVDAGDVVMLWLRPQDLSALPAGPIQAAAVFMSGLMGGLENSPLPPVWRARVGMAYPADLPDGRQVRMYLPLTWFKIRNIPVVDQRVQSDTYLACGIVSEVLSEMLDDFLRDLLLERMELMLNTRLSTGYYARLGLAQGQRFASKGGYIARFADTEGTRLVADGGYMVP